MKFKILSVVVIILALISSIEVKAASYNGYIYEDEKIPGVYFYKHREDTEEEKFTYHNFHSQAAIHRRSSDNAIVYCIESWQTLTGSKAGDFLEVTDDYLTNLSISQINKIKRLAYFGYGYKDKNYDHTDIKWYAITQYLIWLVQAPNIEHYFVDSISSKTPINMFANEINELNSLVNSLPTMMSSGYNDIIMLGDSKKYKIDNLEDFEISYSDNIAVETNYNTNTIKVTPLSKGETFLTLRKRYNRTGNSFKYYLSDEYQNTMSIGDIEDRIIDYRFQIETGTIEIMPFEENLETKDKIPLNGYMYGIFAKENIYVNGIKIYAKDASIESSISQYGIVKFTSLPIGEYYIKELFYMGEYYDFNKVIDITIENSNTVKQEIYYHRQKLKISLKKYLSSPIIKDENIYYSLITKAGIKFGLFNENDELISTATSNSTGDIIFDLTIPYGNYYVKEISTLNNYYLSDFILPITFERKGTDEYQIIGNSFEIVNYHKAGILNIIKIDEDSKEVLSGVKFAIYNEQDEIVSTVITDSKGKVSITLPYGNYYIKELSTLNNYVLPDEKIFFSITSEIQDIEITNKLKEEIEVDKLSVLMPNTSYQPIEVELAKTDDYSNMNIFFYLFSSISLIILKYVKKVNV